MPTIVGVGTVTKTNQSEPSIRGATVEVRSEGV